MDFKFLIWHYFPFWLGIGYVIGIGISTGTCLLTNLRVGIGAVRVGPLVKLSTHHISHILLLMHNFYLSINLFPHLRFEDLLSKIGALGKSKCGVMHDATLTIEFGSLFNVAHH